MKPLVGWGLSGPCFRGRGGRGAGDGDDARLGEPAWGRAELLRDLELRLGLPRVDAPMSVRLPRWASRMEQLADARAFYAASFRVDALGTASTLLAWRDALVEAGWDGAPIPDGGDRLDALAAIEGCGGLAVPPGMADRLVLVERELRQAEPRVYDEVALVEDRSLWSQRWQRIFALLEQRGTRITSMQPALEGAPADTDLGLLQRLLRGDLAPGSARLPAAIRGDGTLLLLRGETPAELAALTAGFLASRAEGALVIRGLDSASLEGALVRHGSAGQGHTGSSGWRPAMQILPLALELAYEPRDPYRVLELLTLPIGPFQGLVGSMLAKAVARQPGVGGQEWSRRKERALAILRESEARKLREAGRSEAEADAGAASLVAERTQRIAEWLEAPGAGKEGATRANLLALAGRVRTWLQRRLAASEDAEIYGAAFSQAQALTEALANDPRDHLRREDARHLLDTVARASHGHVLSVERAGRVAHVDHPSAVLAATATVLFWGFVAGTEQRTTVPPWHRAERDALRAAGVAFPEPGRLLAVESEAWRRGVLAARERVVFVVPGTVKGEAMSPHPLWDEIAARLELDSQAIARLTRHAQTLLAEGDATLAPIETLPPLLLPAARSTWTVPAGALVGETDERGTSATALERLASCPLSWVLARRARLRSGAIAKVASGALLNGSLGHRLVEELHVEHAFDEPDEDAFELRAAAVLERLIRTEAATLLLAGGAFERAQLAAQLVRAMRALHRYLTSSGYRIEGVEEDVETESGAGMLFGRLDVRLVDARGGVAVLDLKWGSSSYEARITGGLAVQLAAYARALRDNGRGPLPPAGYFALSTGRVLTADPRMKASSTLEGPTLDETWSRIDRTTKAVMKSLVGGSIQVAARRALPLLERLAIADKDTDKHFQPALDTACEYCPYPAICGRDWEALQ